MCSPISFNIMINDVFEGVDERTIRALYADDEKLWVRGHNSENIRSRM